MGLRQALISFTSVTGHLALLGFGQTLVKYLPYYADDKKKSAEFLFFCLLVPVIGAVLVTVCIYLFSGFLTAWYSVKSPEFSEYFYLTTPLTIALIFSGVLTAYSRSLKRVVFPSIINELFLKGALSILIIIYGTNYKSNESSFWHWFIGIYFMALILLTIYLLAVRCIRLKFSFSFLKDIGKKKEIFQYSVFSLLSGFSGAIVNAVDVLMIAKYVNMDYTGIYSIGLFMATLIDIPRRALSQITTPVIAEAWSIKDYKMLEEMYKKTSLNQLIIGMLVFLLIWLSIDNLFLLIPKTDVFIHAKYVVLFIGISKLINMAFGVNGEIIQFSDYYRFNLYSICFLGVVAAIMNYSAIRAISNYGESLGYSVNVINELQIIGVSIATLFSIIAFNSMRSIYLYKKLRIQPFTYKTIVVILLSAVVFIVGGLVPDVVTIFNTSLFNIISNILVKSTIVGGIFVGLMIYFKVSEDINQFASSVFKRFFK